MLEQKHTGLELSKKNTKTLDFFFHLSYYILLKTVYN
jgi:hypothetical protein